MEYITDGTFQEELSQYWYTTYPVHRDVDEGEGDPDKKYFARFGGGGRLGQTFDLPRPAPDKVRFSVDVKVSGGDDKPNGKVQLVITALSGNDTPKYFTFVIYEFGTWQTAQMVLQIDPTVDRMGVMLLVIQGFEPEVAMRKVSFTDVDPADAVTTTKGADKVYEGTHRPEELPVD